MSKLKSIKFPGLTDTYEIPDGTYSKPSTGIPKTDLASDVQTSLGKADSALQESNLQSAVNTALAQAKESGEFKGEKGDKGDTGAAGAAGTKGADGTSVTVTSVSESTADGGSNVVTFSNGSTVTIKNGSKGSQGEKGDTGATGATGAKGNKGDTPVKGTDYWTAADKEEMVDDVLAALPTWTGGSY